MQFTRCAVLCLLAFALPLSGCTLSGVKPLTTAQARPAAETRTRPAEEAPSAYAAEIRMGYAADTRSSSNPGNMDGLISKYAALYDMPESLIRRVIVRESGYNPKARNGPYWGLMQIRHDTATVMGYRGSASGLLDAETNLKYAGKYLRGAYLVANGNPDRAVRLYASGYYYDAKRRGLLEETGLR